MRYAKPPDGGPAGKLLPRCAGSATDLAGGQYSILIAFPPLDYGAQPEHPPIGNEWERKFWAGFDAKSKSTDFGAAWWKGHLEDLDWYESNVPGHTKYAVAIAVGTWGSALPPFAGRGEGMVRGGSRGRGKSVGRRVAGLARRLERIERGIETKWHVTTIASEATAVAWQWHHLTGIAIGTAAIQRIGHLIRGLGLTVRGSVALGPGSTETAVRVMIVENMNNEGAAPVTTELLNVDTWLGVRNVLRGDRGKQRVLYDHTFQITPAGHELETFEIFRKFLQGMHTYEGSLGSESNDGKGALYIGWSTKSSSGFPLIEATAQYSFKDS